MITFLCNTDAVDIHCSASRSRVQGLRGEEQKKEGRRRRRKKRKNEAEEEKNFREDHHGSFIAAVRGREKMEVMSAEEKDRGTAAASRKQRGRRRFCLTVEKYFGQNWGFDWKVAIRIKWRPHYGRLPRVDLSHSLCATAATTNTHLTKFSCAYALDSI